MNRLKVSVSPHIRGPRTTQKIMLDVIIALMPALFASVILFGIRSLVLTALSAAACVACEYGWEKLSHKDVTVSDLSAVVTGILLAFNVPVTMPIWKLLVGDVVAIIVVKMLFGGIGRNFVNPALVGRVVLFTSFTADMTDYMGVVPRGAVDAFTSATPLAVIDELTMSDFWRLLLGVHGGVLGETCSLALLVGFVYLCVRKVIKPIIPVSYLGSMLVFMWLFGSIQSGQLLFTAQPVLALFSGGLMLGAVFMATDYVTTPFTNKGKLIFGLGCGLLTSLMRTFASSAGAVSFSILLMNLVVPYINELTRPKPLGGVAAK